jgi:Zn-dependent peptidase ImmA (M78 family)/DNA-binding XRE family transcriptional regulator
MDRFGDLETQLSSQLAGRLRQAREDAGLSQKEFGEAMGYAPTMISAFENGHRRMKIEDLTKACIVLDKTPDFFLATEGAPAPEPVGLSLRADLETLPSEEFADSVSALLDQIEANLHLPQEEVVDLSDLRPEAAARTILGIAEVFDPPVNMDEVCQALGVPIYMQAMADPLSAAVMTIGEGAFAIGVNATHHKQRRRFSIAHELGHAVLRHEASYYLEYSVQDAWEPPGYRYLDEREANGFAAALLMDERWLREDFAQGLRDVSELAERYEVSPAAMGFRLTNVGLA